MPSFMPLGSGGCELRVNKVPPLYIVSLTKVYALHLSKNLTKLLPSFMFYLVPRYFGWEGEGIMLIPIRRRRVGVKIDGG